eukprot:EG_transcript_21337
MDLLQHTEPPLMEYDGVELLRQVFDSMAKNGKIMMDQLPFLLAGAEVQATAEQVQEAIDEFIPDADDDEALLDFDQVQTLYNQLVQEAVDHAADALLLAAEEERTATVFRRLWQWLQQKNRERRAWQSQFQVRIKPTTRLLLLILLVACIVSASVVVFAVVFIFDHSNSAVIDHLTRDMELLSDGLNLFGYVRPFEHTKSNLQRLSSVLGVVIEQVAYENGRDLQVANLLYQRNMLNDLLDGWYASNARSTVDSAVAIVALWLEGMLAANVTLGDVVAALNAINPRLPPGHEVLLAQNRSG